MANTSTTVHTGIMAALLLGAGAIMFRATKAKAAGQSRGERLKGELTRAIDGSWDLSVADGGVVAGDGWTMAYYSGTDGIWSTNIYVLGESDAGERVFEEIKLDEPNVHAPAWIKNRYAPDIGWE